MKHQKWQIGSKYRLPNVTEFVDGFEFEVYSDGYFEDLIEDFCGWYKYTFGKDNWRSLDEIESLIKEGNIRVEVHK